IVVSVGSRWRHAPASAIDRFADRRAVIVHGELRPGHDSVKVRVASDDNVAVVLPLVGISYFDVEGGYLFHRLLLGVGSHPVQAVDGVPHRGQYVLHHLLRARLGFRWEVARHIVSTCLLYTSPSPRDR